MAEKIIISFFLVASLVLFPGLFTIAVSTSENYIINRDSINFIGGDSSSASYQLQETGGEIATGRSNSTNYILHAGYQMMAGGSLGVTLPDSSAPTLSPNVDVQTGGQADTSLSWLVTSDTGFSFTLKKESNFAGQYGVVDEYSRQFISDYYADITYGWTVPEDYSAFGFSPEGDNIIGDYHDDGTDCGSGSGLGNCWQAIGNPDTPEGDRDWPDRLIVSVTDFVVDSQVVINFRMEVPANTFLADSLEINVSVSILPS